LAISPCASVVTTSNPSSSTHLPLQRRPEELLQANDHHTQLQHLSPVQERWQENSGGGGGGNGGGEKNVEIEALVAKSIFTWTVRIFYLFLN